MFQINTNISWGIKPLTQIYIRSWVWAEISMLLQVVIIHAGLCHKSSAAAVYVS